MNIRLLALLATLCAIGCADDPLEPSDALLARLAAEGCPVPSAVAPADWTQVSGSAFRFRIPDGFRQVFVQPVDSETGLFRAVAGDLTYDFGPYSAAPDLVDGPGDADILGACETTLRGRTVRLAVYSAGAERIVVGWWPNLGEAFGGPASLSLDGRTESPAVVDALLAALLSVEVF